ncbi:ankyrin repeat protein [Holotrichia oblita]|uniref:Ankyrin repeat protein n=1 Tax=Holotrichia oblita TaxID=644536 RepID=A0ACB9T056_HOLOL|nr:ankyrin repeat protein [Holotrichia oblita]
MLKIMEADPKQLKDAINNSKFLLTGNNEGELLPDVELMPFDVSGRLVSQSIPINELGKQLLKASGEGNINEIRLLMNKGAPFTADWLGTSPLHLAAQNNHLEVCEILLRAGISKDAITKVARTPLHMAAYEGHLEIVDCLLKHGADYDCRDMLEMTPLHWAAQNGHAEVVTLLIRCGATTNPVNKFDLTPADLALQIKRHDIVEIINVAIRDPLIATQHLQLEMTSDSNDTTDIMEIQDNDVNYVPITIPMEDVDSDESIEHEDVNMQQTEAETQEENLNEEDDQQGTDTSISESIRYLQEHGITMLPADDSNILSTVMESGHSVVLTEAGKQVLNSIKQSDNVNLIPKNIQKPQPPKENTVSTVNMKKIITVTPEEFLAMTTNGGFSNNIGKPVNKFITIPKNNVKRIVMKKNKTTPITATINMAKVVKPSELSSDVETLKKQLVEAHKTIEEYKIKLRKKELEADRYKQQLKLLLS